MEKSELETTVQNTENFTNIEEQATDTVAAQPETTEEHTDEDADKFLTKLIEAAERRGYVKARNELARAAMASPHLWENPLRRKQQPAEQKPAANDTDFLTHITPNVWD